MVAYIWPIALIVLSNIFYHIFAKSFPDSINPFAALSITYIVAAFASLAVYFFTREEHSGLFMEYAKTNWVPFAFGLSLLALEAGFIYTYQAGWKISTAYVVASVLLSVILIFVGYFLYKEPITWNKILGIAVCLLGLWIINK